jgi:hypothetical protein
VGVFIRGVWRSYVAVLTQNMSRVRLVLLAKFSYEFDAQSRQSARLFLQSSELVPPTRKQVCPLPFGQYAKYGSVLNVLLQQVCFEPLIKK